MKIPKTIAIFLVCSNCLNVSGQGRELLIRANPNFDIYKPYTHLVSNTDSVKSRTFTLAVQYVSHRPKINWSVGFSYKHIYHYAENFYREGYSNSYNYYDLKSKSNSFGLVSEFSRTIQKDKVKRQAIGIGTEAYLAEIFKSIALKRNDKYGGDLDANQSILLKQIRSFFSSSVSASVFYRVAFRVEKRVSYGLRFSLGANIYSDWDQFSRYAWIGLGLEIGFGKKQP